MSRDEVMERLQFTRIRFDRRIAAIPIEKMDALVPARAHTPKQVVAHINAYEALIVERLQAARTGNTTALFRDRVGWQEFNEQVWADSVDTSVHEVLEQSQRVFKALIHEIMMLTDGDMCDDTGIMAHIDPAWLQGRTLAQVIGVDAFEHYPMHYDELELAAAQ
ncbi:MAG: ClbS/DfsB family four-helix bundle protein [Coriobacteriia bacterium]|nr:ClbS/DfsB family four-helix bundle protein [Coriobacteriia bacterium]